MLKATILILGLLLGFPAVADSAFGAKNPESQASRAASAQPGIRFENQARLRRWVLERMTFADGNFSEGKEAHIVLTFMLDRKGRMSELAIKNCSDSTLANKALAVLAKVTPEVLEQENCKPVKGRVALFLAVLLVRESDGALHAMDNYAYPTTDEHPVFMGQGARFFRKWVQEQVETRLGVDATRKSVSMSFIIEQDGSVSNLKLSKKADTTVARAIEQVMEQAPRFTPAVQDGLVVRRRAAQSISFQSAEESPDEVYTIPPVGPKFLGGGIELFRLWVRSNLKHPAEMGSLRGDATVQVYFVINVDGSLTDMKIIKSPHVLLSKAVLDLLATCPKWTPAMVEGEVVRMSMKLPVIFSGEVNITPPPSRLDGGSNSHF